MKVVVNNKRNKEPAICIVPININIKHNVSFVVIFLGDEILQKLKGSNCAIEDLLNCSGDMKNVPDNFKKKFSDYYKKEILPTLEELSRKMSADKIVTY